MRESKLLKITGILMIIGGALMVLLFIFGLLAGTLESANDTATGGFFMLISFIGLVCGVIELIAGIMGAKNWNNPSKAHGCFVMGIVLIGLSIVNNLASVGISGFSGQTAGNLLIGLILPALYTYGALQLKKGA